MSVSGTETGEQAGTETEEQAGKETGVREKNDKKTSENPEQRRVTPLVYI